LRSNILTLLTNFQANLQTTESLEPEERSLIMKLSPLYIQWEQEALKKGEEQQKRLMIESMLEVKFGRIDPELSQIIESLIQLPTKELTQLIMQSNREELLNRFQ
jgi:TRAP-type C4-dicarboxylate transport system substrate-binding protein